MSTRTSQRIRFGASGNVSRRDNGSYNLDKGRTVTGTGISFTAGGTIGDTGNGLAVFPVGASIEVRGSALNSRHFVVTASAAGSLTVVPAVVQNEVAGATVTINAVE